MPKTKAGQAYRFIMIYLSNNLIWIRPIISVCKAKTSGAAHSKQLKSINSVLFRHDVPNHQAKKNTFKESRPTKGMQ